MVQPKLLRELLKRSQLSPILYKPSHITFDTKTERDEIWADLISRPPLGPLLGTI